MSTNEILEQIRALPPETRRQIVEEIWEEYGDTLSEPTSEQIAEFDRRARAALDRPEKSRSWEDVQAGLRDEIKRGE